MKWSQFIWMGMEKTTPAEWITIIATVCLTVAHSMTDVHSTIFAMYLGWMVPTVAITFFEKNANSELVEDMGTALDEALDMIVAMKVDQLEGTNLSESKSDS